MISYAQNFEDVILRRALKDVEHGFYIDIGAQHPIIDSVSLSFYETGWRGVHIEPVPEYAEKLKSARPGEDVLQIAIGNREEGEKFYCFPDTGLSTGIKTIADVHISNGWESRELEVTFRPLSAILDMYAEREIHWLKIDCEGMESDVIASWEPSRVRPWIVVVEATIPLSKQKTYENWEPILVDLGYVFAYDDGLNRFYVIEDKKHLVDILNAPPNVFDDYTMSAITTGFRMVDREAVRRQAYLSKLDHRIEQSEFAIASADDERLRGFLAKIEAVEANLVGLAADKRAMTRSVDRMSLVFDRHVNVANAAIEDERTRKVENERLAAETERRSDEQAALLETLSYNLTSFASDQSTMKDALNHLTVTSETRAKAAENAIAKEHARNVSNEQLLTETERRILAYGATLEARLDVFGSDKIALAKSIDRMATIFDRRAGIAETAVAEERARSVLNERLVADAERRVIEQAVAIESLTTELTAARQEATILQHALQQRQTELAAIKKDATWRAIQPLRRMRKSIARFRRRLLDKGGKTTNTGAPVTLAQHTPNLPVGSTATHRFMSVPVGPRPLLLNRADQIFEELKAEQRSLLEVKA